MVSSTEPRHIHDGGFHDSGLRVEELAWGVPSPVRSFWPVRGAVVIAIGLYLALPDRLIPGPRWVVPSLEGIVLVVLTVTTPHRTDVQSTLRRMLALILIATISVANIVNLGLLVRELLKGGVANGRELIFASVAVWLTNVVAFGLWYWELDRGGPVARHDPHHREPDFLFPQMAVPGTAQPDWAPSFIDYLYVSFTNATAFSPTDTMPLTPMAKLLMLVQSIASLLTVALVAARAVNILN